MNDPNVIMIKYQRWMNWCHHIGLGAFIFNFIHIASGDAVIESPYGWMLGVAAFEIAITSLARSRFRLAALRQLQANGVDLTKQRVAFF